jgi:type I restriction enzyme S subunit
MQDLLTGETRVTPEMNVNEEVEKEPAVITDEDWSEETLTQVADIVMGNSPDSKHYNEEKNGKPFLQGNNEFSYRNPSPDRWCSVDKKIAEKGDIMISIRAPVGDTNIADTNYVIGRGLASVSSEVMNHEFLYHLIGYNQPYLERISVGSTFDSISYREFNYVEVPVPPLWEQERIASILYTVDEMIARTNDLIDEYERLKRGLMQDLLSGDVRTPEDLSVLDEIKLDADSTGADGSSVTQSTLDV